MIEAASPSKRLELFARDAVTDGMADYLDDDGGRMKHGHSESISTGSTQVRELVEATRQGDAVEAWQRTPQLDSVAAELRAIADSFEERASELRDVADALDHAEHETKRSVR
ncbi:MAG: hypothetical protein U5L04_01600 [Trueperaceae bacterium]|nr:hypothetical protein [Trueperaceae bacterium]